MSVKVLIHPAVQLHLGDDVALVAGLLAGELDDEPITASWQYINQELGLGRQRVRYALRIAMNKGLVVASPEWVYGLSEAGLAVYADLKKTLLPPEPETPAEPKTSFQTGIIDNPDSEVRSL